MLEKFPTNGEGGKEEEFELPESSAELLRMIDAGEVPKTMMSKVREILSGAQVEQRDLNKKERQELRKVLHERGITLAEEGGEDSPDESMRMAA